MKKKNKKNCFIDKILKNIKNQTKQINVKKKLKFKYMYTCMYIQIKYEFKFFLLINNSIVLID